jgi:hypothetical protein
MAATTTTRSGSAVRRGDAEIAVEPVKSPDAPAEPASDAMQAMARMIYSGSYALAYGIVYATVFVVQLLPQENPVMQGFQDGGKAAMDEVSRS